MAKNICQSKLDRNKLDKIIELLGNESEDESENLDEDDDENYDYEVFEPETPVEPLNSNISENKALQLAATQTMLYHKKLIDNEEKFNTEISNQFVIPKIEPPEDVNDNIENDLVLIHQPNLKEVKLDVVPIKIESSSEDSDMPDDGPEEDDPNDPLNFKCEDIKDVNIALLYPDQTNSANDIEQEFDTDDEIPLSLSSSKQRKRGGKKALDETENSTEKKKKKNKKPIEKFLKCKICNVFRKNDEYLDLHMKTHEGLIKSEFECHICGKQFSTTCSVIRHHSLHEAAFKHQCEKCGKRFIFSSSLHSHKFKHETDRPHACNICPQTFKAYKHLKRHLFCHTGEKPFECPVCHKRFTERYMLTTHQKVHVQGKTTHNCELCGQSFKLQKKYEYHMTRHANPKPEKPPKLTKSGRPFAKRPHLRKKKSDGEIDLLISPKPNDILINSRDIKPITTSNNGPGSGNINAHMVGPSNILSSSTSQLHQHQPFSNVIAQNAAAATVTQFQMQFLEKAGFITNSTKITNQHANELKYANELRIKEEYDKNLGVKNLSKLPFNGNIPIFPTKSFNPFSPFKMEMPDMRTDPYQQFHHHNSRDSTGDGSNSMFS